MAESETTLAPSGVTGLLSSLLGWTLFGLVILAMGEVGARLDDRFFDGVPFFANPSYESLFYRDEHRFRHGRPDARWKQVRLNNVGMRGEDVSAEPREGCRRLMFLGASETFGEPFVRASEFPAKVGQHVDKGGRNQCVEIFNASFPGIAPQSLNGYYVSVLQRYRPNAVYVYLSTHFYLSEHLPRKTEGPFEPTRLTPATLPAHEDARGLLDKSRLVERLRQSVEMPAFIQKYRDRQQIEELLAAEPDPTRFESVPAERLDYVAADLKALIASIRSSGAEPVLMTHAVRVANPPRDEDVADLFAMRVYVPRVREDVLAAFEYAAAERVRAVAQETGTRIIDVAGSLNGRRELFIDLVHFNATGHEEVSRLIVDELRAHGN